MIDRVKSFREPATIVALIVVLAGIALTAGRIATGLQEFSLVQVLRGSSGLYGLVDALVLTVLALTCVLVRPQTRHAVQLILAAAGLIWLGAIAGLASLLVSLVAGGEDSLARVLESIGGLTDIALRVLMGYVLLLARRVALDPASPETLPPAPAEPEQLKPVDDSTRRPTWQADQAAGVVWRSAADAASGAAAGTYGGGGRGWEVDPQAPEVPQMRQLPQDSQAKGPADDVTRRDRDSPSA